MRSIPLLLATAAAALLAGGAIAQDAPPAPMAPMSMPASSMPAPVAPLGTPDHPIPQSSPTPADQAFHLKAGDPNVVSNPPVADTPENRAAYGQPMSRTGKATKPVGN
jgi:hypothetical protein